MYAKMLIVVFCLVLAAGELSALSRKGYSCPRYDEVRICTPRCETDFQCGSGNKVCCSNNCGTRSCTEPSPVNTGGGRDRDGSKGSSSGRLVVCEGRTCSAGEKCEFDRRSKHYKCVRG